MFETIRRADSLARAPAWLPPFSFGFVILAPSAQAIAPALLIERVAGYQRDDPGPGISEDEEALVFEEFVRLERGAARGAGIGFTISDRIATVLGGEITVGSEVGKGSTFTPWLPERPGRMEIQT